MDEQVLAPAQQVMQGAIDAHVHAMPFINESRMMLDVFELSQQAAGHGMRAVVVKPYYGSSCQLAYLVNKYANGATLVGGVTLNFAAGGFNPDAVRIAAHDGVYNGFRPGRIVWMPERSSLHWARYVGLPEAEQARFLTPFRKSGDIDAGLTPEAREVLEVIAAEDLVLATSHLSPEEGLALIELAKQIGVSRFLLTHASHHGVGYSFEQKQQAVALGAYIEESVITWEPAMSLFKFKTIDANEVIFDAMVELGPQHFCLGTDAGIWSMPTPADAYRVFVSLLLGKGFTVDQVRMMTVDNPTKLLKLDEEDPRPEVNRDDLGN